MTYFISLENNQLKWRFCLVTKFSYSLCSHSQNMDGREEKSGDNVHCAGYDSIDKFTQVCKTSLSEYCVDTFLP